jgi:hypothetical protein
MVFQAGDIRGKKNKAERNKAYAPGPMNLLDKGQNAMNDAARSGYASAFEGRCEECPDYGQEIKACLKPYSRRSCAR